ncbi:MAG TPA: ArsI/CadI family heavy metal resistance metalloenzyme [Burkholderiaceae bacterium]|nr:ArsI/CadI family heavy metal resistance metalloenzyme [Burkholderiaceae bacterium]
MKRFHVHVAVKDLESSIRFYSALFGAEPSVTKPDYAKWMVDDPRINFAISQRGSGIGVNHLGLQVDSDDELELLRAQAQRANLAATAEKDVRCCYARGNKYWYTDPQGVAWETYHTLEQVEFFQGEQERESSDAGAASGCCGPSTAMSAQERPVKSACC